jgi:hypothetical protein
MVFNDTSDLRGLVQEYERECGFDYGEVSGSTIRLKEFAAGANNGLDEFFKLAIQANGTWKLDDSNHADYAIISADLIAGQRDYPVTQDQDGNAILEVFKVFVAAQDGVYREILPVSVADGAASPDSGAPASGQLYGANGDLSGFTDGRNQQGVPSRYDKQGNAILLDPVPSYNMRQEQEGKRGLKLYVNREAKYLAYNEPAAYPGIPGLFHRYLALWPAEQFLRRKNAVRYAATKAERMTMEADIQQYFAGRARDVRRRITTRQESNK